MVGALRLYRFEFFTATAGGGGGAGERFFGLAKAAAGGGGGGVDCGFSAALDVPCTFFTAAAGGGGGPVGMRQHMARRGLAVNGVA